MILNIQYILNAMKICEAQITVKIIHTYRSIHINTCKHAHEQTYTHMT